MLNVNLQPKQIELYNLVKYSEYTKIGYGGSAGGAKSHAVRDVQLILATEHPGIKMSLFRRINKQLTKNHIIPFFTKYPELRKYFNKTEKTLYYPNGSILFCISSDKEDSIFESQGDEWDISFVDEATHFTESMLGFISTRTRTTRSDIIAKTVFTMNPGGIGHKYIKRIFIDKIFKEYENADEYKFMSARIYDNIIWVQKQLKKDGIDAFTYYEKWTDEQRKRYCYKFSDYAKELMNKPDDLRLAYLEGDWNVFGGQFFKEFDKKKQVIKPFEIPDDWQLIGALDPGYSSPCAFHLLAKDFNNNIYCVATYYEEEKNPKEHSDGINSFITSNIFTKGRKPSKIISGLDAWAKKDRYAIMSNDLTFSDIMSASGLYLSKAITDRVNGWWSVKMQMKNNLFFFDNFCNDTINEIQSVISDAKKVEDIQGRGNDPNVADHAIDALRYGIMSLVSFNKDSEKEKEKLKEIKKRNRGRII